MRKHPLLALFTTTATLAATGTLGHALVPTSAAASTYSGVPGDAVNSGAVGVSPSGAVAPTSLMAASTTTTTLGAVRARIFRPAILANRGVAPESSVHRFRALSRTFVLSMTGRAIRRFLRSDVSAAEPLALELIIGSRGRRTLLGAGARQHAARLVQMLYIESAPARSSTPNSTGTWLALRTCESGNSYVADTGNGYYGAYQFSANTWRWIGYSGLPDDASSAAQDRAARALQARVGWGAWPVCSSVLGLR